VDEYWDFHCGLNEFNTLDKYRRAIAKRYGEMETVEEFARKAQTLNYELMRPMFEAFRVHTGQATGVIQWMLNAAWPKMYWQLYDWYLMPTGAFYGARKACEPQQLIYHYGDNSIYVAKGSPVGWAVPTSKSPGAKESVGTAQGSQTQTSAFGGPHPTSLARTLRADIRVYDIESKLLLAAHVPLGAECGTSKVFKLPGFDRISTTYFLSLRLLDANGAELARNFYWLSTKRDVLDYQAKVEPWEYYTPSNGYADLTMLNHLPPAQVEVKCDLGANGPEVRVELTNRNDRIAFFIELLLTEPGSDEPIVPVFWQDNYVSLLPNETRIVSATLPPLTQGLVLTVRGWNVGQVCCLSA
jgi:exo-1,4-beta-D-glucosaminidase